MLNGKRNALFKVDVNGFDIMINRTIIENVNVIDYLELKIDEIEHALYVVNNIKCRKIFTF